MAKIDCGNRGFLVGASGGRVLEYSTYFRGRGQVVGGGFGKRGRDWEVLVLEVPGELVVD